VLLCASLKADCQRVSFVGGFDGAVPPDGQEQPSTATVIPVASQQVGLTFAGCRTDQDNDTRPVPCPLRWDPGRARCSLFTAARPGRAWSNSLPSSRALLPQRPHGRQLVNNRPAYTQRPGPLFVTFHDEKGRALLIYPGTHWY
jgi:hypothetical protein